jgi:mannose-6-phosphate isomerase-like protein (cupin superfamily)
MSTSTPRSASPVVARAARAERLEFPDGSTMTLLADSPATGGKLSIHHTTLRNGADGASPHHHTAVAEVLYVLAGAVHVLVDDEIVEVGEGDLAVIPAGVTHAFGAPPDCDADLLVAAMPGIERFELFRQIARVLAGRQSTGALSADQSRYDTYPDTSQTWNHARTNRDRQHENGDPHDQRSERPNHRDHRSRPGHPQD